MNEKHLILAAQMLRVLVEDLPEDLVVHLNKANELCEAAGGQLVSRQVIASIIVTR